MKILIYGGSCIKHNYSFIAPMRIIRACHRHGDEVKLINWADTRIESSVLKYGKETHVWGESWTLGVEEMFQQLEKLVEEWKPDLIYSMGQTSLDRIILLGKSKGIPVGALVGDPFYAGYPSQSYMDFICEADFLTFNEGQAWNHLKIKKPELAHKFHLLNHAIDPELAPTLEEVIKTKKEYIVSCVGGDDRIRRRELVLYYYQWTNHFPTYKFGVGGSLGKGGEIPYTIEDLSSSVNESHRDWNHTTFTDEEVTKFANYKFNIEKLPLDLPYPLGMSHESVHKFYMNSYYGFTPYGHYLVAGEVSDCNTFTFGTKIFEECGSGCAMIANRIKDIEHIIKHGENGFIFDKPEDAFDAISFAIKKPEEVIQMGINAYKFAHEFHSWNNRYTEVLLPIFKSLGVK